MSTAPRPNLFVVGSMKAGTTSLQRHLLTHPQIFMTTDPKEPTYFLTREQLLDVLPGVEKRGFWRDEKRYLKLFEGAGRRPVIGEASANYARLPRVSGVAERIAEFNPDARIVFIMRDPVERTISHYWYMVRFFAEKRDIASALEQESDYTETSHYAMQLAPWLEYFGPDRVWTMTTEELRDHGPQAMSSLFGWLGVDAGFLPPNLHERANEAPDEIRQIRGSGLWQDFRNSPLWNRVGPLVPKSLRTLGRGLAEKPVERKTVDLAPVRRWLREVHRPQTLRLEQLLDRQFPEWKSLWSDA